MSESDHIREQLAFAERDRDRLREDVHELTKQVLAMDRRLAIAERLIQGLNGRFDEIADRGTEKPPHAAGTPSDDVT